MEPCRQEGFFHGFDGKDLYYEYFLAAGGTAKYGEVKSERDAMSNKTSYERDAMGNVTKITYPDNGVETFSYDAQNHCVYHKNQTGVVTRYEYSEQGLLLREIVELDSSVSYSASADPAKFAITAYTYYESGELACPVYGLVKTVTSPEGGVTTFTYDKYGNRTEMKNALGNVTTYQYDSFGRLTAQISPEGYKTGYAYDGAGRLTKTVLHDKETTEVIYDNNGRPVKQITAEGKNFEYKYDAAGNVIFTARDWKDFVFSKPAQVRYVRMSDMDGRVLYESYQAGRMAAEYLLGLGHTDLLHVFGLDNNYDSRRR